MWVWIDGELTQISRFSRIKVRTVQPAKGDKPAMYAVVASTIDSPRPDTYMHLYESTSEEKCTGVLNEIHWQLQATSSCIDIRA